MKDLKKLFKILKDKIIEKAYSFKQASAVVNLLHFFYIQKFFYF